MGSLRIGGFVQLARPQQTNRYLTRHNVLENGGFTALGLRDRVRNGTPSPDLVSGDTPAASWWRLVAHRDATGALVVTATGEGQTVAPGVTGNEKKFKALVADFVATTADLGGTIDPEVVAIELRQRIQFIAAQIRVAEATLLRNCMPDDWGREMARQTYRLVKEREARIDAAPGRQLPLPAAGRLIAALGQAPLFADVNNAATDPAAAFNQEEASQAVTELGIALTSYLNEDATVTVQGRSWPLPKTRSASSATTFSTSTGPAALAAKTARRCVSIDCLSTSPR